ncbi:hypothetical protein QE152_g29680 [Popillia japonica]|uniref:PHD-type domain-containing protein n=1 Tax=Popillia japonica TaxID=7064 RepID=A0AAW1JHG4_POPJA
MMKNPPVSNAVVENYFGQLKHITLEGQKNMKCSQFVRKLRQDIIAIKTEAEIGITKNRLTKVDHTDEKHSQEVWRNRARKTETHFSGKYLKGVPSVAIKELVIYPEDDKDIAQCAYCGHGMLDETTSWVQCDKCLRWIHQECDITNPSKTYSDDFVCKLCALRSTTFDTSTKSSETNYIYKECLTYLERLQMTSVERENLEISTRTQRSSSIWWNERKIRVTTSFFGSVCKVKDTTSFANIIKCITDGQYINTAATAHGTKCEKLAIEAYVQKTNALCHPAGLFVHRDCNGSRD